MTSSSKLIIPDIHHRIDLLDRFLKRNGDQYCERYFLGDFQDQFHDTPADAAKTAKYVKDLLEDPRNHICLGNHDMPYMFPWNSYMDCPGFERAKSVEVNKILSVDDWTKMRLAFSIDGWLISHAGIHASLFGQRAESFSLTHEDILASCVKALQRVCNNGWDTLLMPGSDRGFHGQQLGGITWLDWQKLQPIPGLKQIVGHTPSDTNVYMKYITERGNPKHCRIDKWGRIEAQDRAKSMNVCLDTNNQHFGVLEDGELYVYPTIDFL
jgi:hypothetical protein